MRMKNVFLVPLLFLAGLAGSAGAAIVDVLPGDPGIRYLGRHGTDKSSSDIQWAWSGAGASITFEGTSCSIRMKAPGSIYSVFVDGKETKVLDLSGASANDTMFSLATGLPPGTHTVSVRLRTEASHSLTRFRGFRIDGTPGTAPRGSDRRIEFYGNSITCGYGILDDEPTNSFRVQTEHEGVTFAAQAADAVGADRHTICWSGRGVVQNYGGDTKSPTVPRLYKQVVTWDTTVVWDFSLWVPQVVVIDLGTNDYSAAAPPPDSAKFFQTYRAFVDTLHARYPQARFVLVDGPMLSDDYPEGMKALSKVKRHLANVVADVTKRGIEATHLSLTPQDAARGWGADYHPNLAQAALNGAELAAHLRSVMDWGASPVRSRSVGSVRALLERTPGGLSARIPDGARAAARFVDLRGRVAWSRDWTSGPHALSDVGNGGWLHLRIDGETQVLAVPPDWR
jgi:hypothetical protein